MWKRVSQVLLRGRLRFNATDLRRRKQIHDALVILHDNQPTGIDEDVIRSWNAEGPGIGHKNGERHKGRCPCQLPDLTLHRLSLSNIHLLRNPHTCTTPVWKRAFGIGRDT